LEIEDALRELDRKVKQLKLDYERYFLGTRPREPVLLRGEVDKAIVILSSTAIQNTALRFRYNSICSRYHAQKRQWTETVRKIEQGTYERHVFKANLRDRERGQAQPQSAAPPSDADLFSEYRDARLACGQGVEKLSREKLDSMLARQEKALKERFGDDARFRFRVVVEDGKAKVKAARIRAAS